MKKIYIRTHAYNASKTLRRTVDSVLHQTHTDYIYYLCDNGSTDGGATRQIIEAYAALDRRIVPFYNEVNHVWEDSAEYIDLPLHVDDDDYFCELDADDEYLPTFFEEMLGFMQKYDLDIACCGNDFLDTAQENRLVRQRLLHETLILEGQQFAELFPWYHGFMRTCWGKLYKGSVLRNYITRHEDCPNYPVAYGGDTFNTMRVFQNAKRVGILPRSLHRYYISPKSVSYTMHPQRVQCDQILHEVAIDYLSVFGTISQRNWEFLYEVYMYALRDTAEVLLRAEMPDSEKLHYFIEMVNCRYTHQLMAWENFDVQLEGGQELQDHRKELFKGIANWLLSLREVANEQAEDYCRIGELSSAAAAYSEGWIAFRKRKVMTYIQQGQIEKAKTELNELKELLPEDEDVQYLSRLIPTTEGTVTD